MASFVMACNKFLEEIERNADPRVKNWFLMHSPLLPISIIVFYLLFVMKLGPELMKNREPFKIEKLIILYNAVQVISAAYIVKEACRVLWFHSNYNFFCIEIDYTNTATGIEKARTVWFYFMTKFLDLLDTVFFVLRKKQSHVTFLHVYHHTMVFSLGWFITKYYPGGHVAFFGTINSFVHMIMYSYYLITALHLWEKQMLWCKKYVTQLQLIQFVITGVHGLMTLVQKDCYFPKYLIAIGIPQDILMFWLFLDFYRKTYSKKSTKISFKKQTVNASIKDLKSD